MDQQTPDQGWEELQAHLERFFEQVRRVEKEIAVLSSITSTLEPKNGQSEIDRRSIRCRMIGQKGLIGEHQGGQTMNDGLVLPAFFEIQNQLT
jgi:hypothetical protein